MAIRAKYVEVQYANAHAIAERWKRNRYRETIGWADKDRDHVIYDRLAKMGSDPDIEAVAEIIGNKSWPFLWCDSCREYVARAVRIGEECSGDTHVYCATCIAEAHAVLNADPAP